MKAPSQSKTAMRVRIECAKNGECWCSWEYYGDVWISTQPMEIAG